MVRGRRPSCREKSAGEDPAVELQVGGSDEGLIMIIVMQVESDEKDDIWLSLGKRSAAARSGVLCD